MTKPVVFEGKLMTIVNLDIGCKFLFPLIVIRSA